MRACRRPAGGGQWCGSRGRFLGSHLRSWPPRPFRHTDESGHAVPVRRVSPAGHPGRVRCWIRSSARVPAVRWCRCTAGRAGAPFAPRSGLTNVWSFGLADPTCTRFRKLSTLGGSICWWIAFPVVQGVPRIGCVVMRTAAGVRFRVSRAPCTAAAPPTVSRETVGGAPDRVLYRSAAHRFGTGPLPSPAGRPGLAPRTRRCRDRRRAVQSSRSASRGPGIDGDACRRPPWEALPSPAAATAVPIGRARWEPSSDPILCPGLVRMGVSPVPSGGSECVRPQG
ncbi:hypothetical protein C8K38_103101 [Rhodococcus sp. OK611]|nr:hypothetical protein C8K38_103101 [Rhodococcus sp. OK611]SNX90046.1 hypothetical protein SAMN05447004_104101 [Rhodococcus sp. OK270]